MAHDRVTTASNALGDMTVSSFVPDGASGDLSHRSGHRRDPVPASLIRIDVVVHQVRVKRRGRASVWAGRIGTDLVDQLSVRLDEAIDAPPDGEPAEVLTELAAEVVDDVQRFGHQQILRLVLNGDESGVLAISETGRREARGIRSEPVGRSRGGLQLYVGAGLGDGTE